MKSFLLSVLMFFNGLFLPHHSPANITINKPSTSINTITPSEIPTPTDIPFVANTITYTSPQISTPTPSPETIDCTGPDEKHLQITKQQCDDFNASWGNYTELNADRTYATQIVSCHLNNSWYTITRTECTNLQNYYGYAENNYNTTTPVYISTPEPTSIPVPTLPTYPGGQDQCRKDKYAELANQLVQLAVPSGEPTPTFTDNPVLYPSTSSSLGIQAMQWCFENFAY